jgi:hypothetical protein
MLSWLKLSHHHHSGRLRPHEHTSYLPLGLFLLVVGLALTVYTATAVSPLPESGSIGLAGTVPGKPPTVAATIKAPNNQQRFSTSPVTVSGTCLADALVEVFKNDIFAGSTVCTNTGTYSLEVDLLIGQNILTARIYDALNQPGPASNAVTVFYDALPIQGGALIPFDFGGDQLLLNTDAVFRGVFPDQELSIPIDILGGAPPYAVNIQWGDSSNRVVPRHDNTPFKVGHTYKKPGTYQITLQASDTKGRVAFLTVASIVNGSLSAAPVATASKIEVNQLLLLWPLYTSVLAAVLSFWLGERREKYLLKKHGLLVAS